MTTIFRSYLRQAGSIPDQSISHEQILSRTNSIVSLHSGQFDEDTMDFSSVETRDKHFPAKPTTICPLHSPAKDYTIEENQHSRAEKAKSKNNNTIAKRAKKRGPRYSRISEKSPPLFTRLLGTIFGDSDARDRYKTNQTQKKRTNGTTKKLILPSNSTIKKQFEDNEETLRSLVTLLSQIESNIKGTTNQTDAPIEQARNNNRMEDTLTSCSNDTYQQKSKAKVTHQYSRASKHLSSSRLTKKRQSEVEEEEDTLSTSSITTHYSSRSSSTPRRKTMDSQQQTQIYPTKINTATSTQFHQTNVSEPSWLDVMRDDQTTNDAWARIRRKLKPNQQKDILR
ncbi:unnamed protein product [Adineta ricciae]|nr:unnamed protein product [Adineta ricciae]